MASTYSFLDLSGACAHPSLGAYSFTGQGAGSVTVAMATEKTVHNVAADGTVMVSKVAGDNGTIVITCQQTSELHKWLTWAYNLLRYGDVADWAKMVVELINTSDGTSHTATGVSFQKMADKPYQAQGQMVTWTLMAANIVSVTA